MFDYYLEFLGHFFLLFFFMLLTVLPALIVWFIAYKKDEKSLTKKSFLVFSVMFSVLTLIIAALSIGATRNDAFGGLVYIYNPFILIIVALTGMIISTFLKTKKIINKKFIKITLYSSITLICISLIALIYDVSGSINMNIAARTDNVKLIHYMYKKAVSKNKVNHGILLFLAQNKKTPTSVLEKIVFENDSYANIHAANHPNATDEMVCYVAKTDTVARKYLKKDVLKLNCK